MSENEIDCMHWFTQTAINYAEDKPTPCHFGFGDDCGIYMNVEMAGLREKMVVALRFKDMETATKAHDEIRHLLFVRFVEKFSYMGQGYAECLARQHASLGHWHAAYGIRRVLELNRLVKVRS